MLNKNITYDVLFDQDKVGEIKNDIYYDVYGKELYMIKGDSLFHGERMIGPISIDTNGAILTRFADEQILTLQPKTKTVSVEV